MMEVDEDGFPTIIYDPPIPIDGTPVPMDDPATVHWNLIISDADFKKIKAGFRPPDMDYKWVILTEEDPDQSDRTTVRINRSWTLKERYILAIKSNKSSIEIETITWEQDNGGIHISEEQSKKDTIILCRTLLDCEFSMFPDYGIGVL